MPGTLDANREDRIMRVESLKNYGRPFSETMTELPDAVRKRIRGEGAKVIRRRLGLFGMLRFLFLTWKEKRRMRRMAFIDLLVENTAMFSATAEMVGMERALSIHHAIMDRVAVPLNEALIPSSSEFGQLEDPFGALRKYLLAFFEAEHKAGLHEYRVVEDSDDALAVDVTYCAFCEIPKCLGIMDACEPGCYSDEVFMPHFLGPLGLRLVRTKTLAPKGDRCDFRYERVSVHIGAP
jgi:hypothetical protein